MQPVLPYNLLAQSTKVLESVEIEGTYSVVASLWTSPKREKKIALQHLIHIHIPMYKGKIILEVIHNDKLWG